MNAALVLIGTTLLSSCLMRRN